ncbi:MAG: ABC transporter substrate-binding protein [Clostridia bacterium]
MKRRVKPFTLFLWACTLLFLIFAPHMIMDKLDALNPAELLSPPKEEWTGILNLWEIASWQTGYGSRVNWLNKRIYEFERRHPGVFIELRLMKPEAANLFIEGKEVLPDIISFPPGMISNPASILSPMEDNPSLKRVRTELLNAVKLDGKTMGVPWMMGSYGILVNMELTAEREVVIPDAEEWNAEAFLQTVKECSFEKELSRKQKEWIYGFDAGRAAFTFPLISLFWTGGNEGISAQEVSLLAGLKRGPGLVPDGFAFASEETVWDSFVNGRAAMMLGNQRNIYGMLELEEQGKSFEWIILPFPRIQGGRESFFNDQVQFMGAVKQDKPAKEKVAKKFICSILEEEVQAQLTDLGVFPVLANMDRLYENEEKMDQMEKHIHMPLRIPNAFKWKKTMEGLQGLFEELISGNNRVLTDINKVLEQCVESDS